MLLIMDLLWLILPAVGLCLKAEDLTEVKVLWGQNVTLSCSLNSSNIYWYMEIHSGFRGGIVRTFPGGSSTFYVSTSVSKYAAVENRLVITNITADDCRLYFCGRKQSSSIVLEDSFHLVSDVPPTPSTNNSEANHQQQQHIWTMVKSELVLYSSLALNVLLLVLTGLGFTCVCVKAKNHQVNDPPPLTCENPETLEIVQYEEIQLPPLRAPPPAGPPLECIYSKAQLPGFMLP